MNIVLFEPWEVDNGDRVEVSDVRARHLLRVLRVTSGSVVRIGVIDGPLGIGTVTGIADTRVTLQCALEVEAPERPRVDFLLALPRPKVLRRLWAHLAALGVGRVMLTNAGKVERDYFDSHIVHDAGFRPLLIEGLQQARDTRMPIVSVHKRLTVLIEDELDALCPDGRRLVAHPDARTSIGTSLADTTAPDRVLLAVGPEGGWNDFELALLERHGFTRVTMGPRTLATTTACVALLTLAHAALSAPNASEDR